MNLFFSVILIILSINLSFADELKFRFPIANKDRKLINKWPIYGYDHNKKNHKFDAICKNYKNRGFPNCYDEHKGTDFILKGGFRRMDNGSAEVVAAERGEVIDVQDGHYDRCRIHWLRFKVTCRGHEMVANKVTIRHPDGTKTRYLHLKKGSVKVHIGQKVTCGQKLGLIGSSGYSSMPHLHFDVYNKKGDRIDPYSGPNSQSFSYWKNQNSKDRLPSGKCN